MGSKDINLKDDYYSNIDRLSNRSKNVIDYQLGGIDKMLEYYSANETFLKIQYVGPYTNMELCSYSHYLLNNKSEDGELVMDNKLNEESTMNMVQFYSALKKHYPTKTIKQLEKIENHHIRSGFRRIDDYFIRKYFNISFDFSIEYRLEDNVINDLNEIKYKIDKKFGLSPIKDNLDSDSFFENLSNSSKKTINNVLGGIEKMLEYYLQFKSFMSLYKVGTNINRELCSYCRYLINNPATKTKDTQQDIINLSPEDLLIHYYFLKKEQSLRTVNILDNLEEQYKKAVGHGTDEGFIHIYFINKYNYYNISGVGTVTADELKELRFKIQNKSGIKNIEPNNLIRHFPVFELFKNTIDINEFNTIFEDGQINIFRLLILHLYKLKFKEHDRPFFLYYYFENYDTDENELVLKTGISRERINLLKQKFRKKYLPETIAELKEIVADEYQLFSTVDSLKNYFIPAKLESITLNEMSYKPNSYFEEMIYYILYKDIFQSLHLLLFKYKERKSFKHFTEHILISTTFIRVYTLDDLIDWLDEQIYEFAIEELDYDFEELINRFYKEELNITIPKEALRDILYILDERRRDNWDGLDKEIYKRQQKNGKQVYINCIYNFIKDIGRSVKTDEIVSYLNANNYEIKKDKLLSDLKRMKSRFHTIGNGHWDIKKEGNEEKISGSIRDIIYKMLNEHDDPMHISRIVNEISKHREINAMSI